VKLLISQFAVQDFSIAKIRNAYVTGRSYEHVFHLQVQMYDAQFVKMLEGEKLWEQESTLE
jgi:hypothetical protein